MFELSGDYYDDWKGVGIQLQLMFIRVTSSAWRLNHSVLQAAT